MILRKLFLTFAAGLLLAGQLGWAQSSVRLTAADIHALASKAAQTGKPLPVVPESANPVGNYRPHIWVARQLAKPQSGGGLPGFCNAPWGSYYIFCPNGLQTAYSTSKIVGGGGGAGIVIGIVDAFHYAGAEADLNYFSARMGLPACTIASTCFTQINQDGGAPRAPADSGWELETMLDLEYAHAMAPNAKLVLVESDDNYLDNMGIAVTRAVGLADVISNSYGTNEFGDETSFDILYYNNNVNKPLLFSSGDAGAPSIYPCTSPYVTCVGGTTLTVNASLQRTSETGWTYSGGGCSTVEPSQGYQLVNGVVVCPYYRATPDIAADGDPNTGVAVYDSGNGGYHLVGGTSLSTPLMAGILADIDAARVSFGKAKFGGPNGGISLDPELYDAYSANLPYFYFDVLTGNNGYAAGTGFDLVTGMGVSKAPAMANRFFGLP
ncbi:MAG: S53 family peptidase [Terriglobia bacterium]|jgi:subtilase family serine protease